MMVITYTIYRFLSKFQLESIFSEFKVNYIINKQNFHDTQYT